MLFPTTITQKWQMTLPKQMRQALDIRSPGKVLLELDEKKSVLKIRQAKSIIEMAGSFKPKKAISALKTREKFEKQYARF